MCCIEDVESNFSSLFRLDVAVKSELIYKIFIETILMFVVCLMG